MSNGARIDTTTRRSHPAAGTFVFGVGGTVGGGIPGARQHELTLSVGFFGTQLIISENSTAADATGRVTTGHSSIWRLDPDGRLVIEFREERSKERPKTATRVYVRKR